METNHVHQAEIGQIVRVTRGRESGKYAVVIQVLDAKTVLIADGDKRKFDQPKRKNLLHLQLTETISPEVQDSIKETGRVTNGKLRFALNKFVESQADAERKEN